MIQFLIFLVRSSRATIATTPTGGGTITLSNVRTKGRGIVANESFRDGVFDLKIGSKDYKSMIEN